MTELVVFPDAELLFSVALEVAVSGSMAGPVRAFTQVPKVRPSEFLVVRRVGGSRRNLVTDVPTLAVEAYALRPSRSILVASHARGAMYSFTDINGYAVYDVEEFAGPGDLPDPLAAEYTRTAATYAAPVRAREAIQL